MENSNLSTNITNREELTFNLPSDPITELREQQYEAKITSLQPESAVKFFKDLQKMEEIAEGRMLKYKKKPYNEIKKTDRESLIIYLGLKGAPTAFEPQDIYEIYSIKNYRYFLPLTLYFTTVAFGFSSYTHVMNGSKLLGLTFEYCLRTRLIGFVGFPLLSLNISRAVVNRSTQEEFDSYIMKYDLDNELFEQAYNNLVFPGENSE